MAFLFDSKTAKLIKLPAFILVGVIAMSIYQSIILMPIALILSKEMIKSLEDQATFKSGALKLIDLIISMILIYAIYSVFTHIIQKLLNIPPSSYLADMASWGKDSTKNVLKGIAVHLYWRLTNNSHFGLGIYCITIISVFAIAIRSISKGLFYPIVLVIGVYIYPFTLDILTGSWLPARTLTQMPVCMASLIVLSLFNSRKYFLYLVSFVLLCVGSSNSNRLFYADYVTNQQDSQLSQMMLSDLMRQYPSFNARNNKIYFYGADPLNNKWKPWNSENFGMSFFQYGDSRIVNYLNMTGYMDLKRVDKIVIDSLHDKIESMPCWPEKGAIFNANENYIIKYCSRNF